ncbi:MAG: hypothetical protein OEX00_11395, partial [Gammaproteobacteria bacterium]|nr:hypothetical protein [Gammaproteobacteria bacterium]
MTIIRRAIKARCTVALVCLFFPVFGNAVPIFFNEIHYENSGADINERIEIAGPAGTVLDDWQIALYNGSTGSQYGRKHLSGVIPNLLDGFGVFSFAFDRPHLQNGPADAFALIDPFGLVLQFLSYEGMVSAIDGLALGLSSDDIGVSEHPDTPA